MKKMVGIIGVGLVVGVAVYVVWNANKKAKADDVSKKTNKKEYIDDIPLKNGFGNTSVNEEEFIIVKSNSAEEIATRHEVAEEIIKDAVDIICKRSEVPENENEELERISDELDELLKGE